MARGGGGDGGKGLDGVLKEQQQSVAHAQQLEQDRQLRQLGEEGKGVLGGVAVLGTRDWRRVWLALVASWLYASIYIPYASCIHSGEELGRPKIQSKHNPGKCRLQLQWTHLMGEALILYIFREFMANVIL